ncbi:hypothetical protein LguiB_007303 [Lonicera macranthoides]
MENGDGIGDKSHLGDMNSVQDAAMESKLLLRPTNGSEESIDSEEVDVFEEATGAGPPAEVFYEKVDGLEKGEAFDEVAVSAIIDEQSASDKVGFDELKALDADALAQNGKDEVTGVTYLGSATCQLELLKDGHDMNEKSENGVPDTVNLDQTQSVGIIDEQSSVDEIGMDEMNARVTSVLLDNIKDEASGVSDLGAAGGMELRKDGPEVNERSVNGVLDDVNLNETPGVGIIDDEQTSPGEVVRDELNVRDTAVLANDGKNEASGLSDFGSAGEMEHFKDDHGVNGKPDAVNLDRTLVHGNLDDMDADKQELHVRETPETEAANKVEGLDMDCQQDIESSGESLHEVVKNVEIDNVFGVLSSDSQDENKRELEGASAVVHLNSQADEVLESEGSDTDCRQGIETNGDILHEVAKDVVVNTADLSLKDTSAPTGSHNPEEDCKLEDKLCSPVEERTITVDVSRPPSSEDSLVEKVDKTHDSASDLGSNSSKPRVTQVSSALGVNPLNREAKGKEVKQSTVASREQEIRPVATPAPTPARPAGLGRAAPLLEPAPRVVQQSRVNGTVPQVQTQLVEDPTNGEADENDETREKLQMIRVKFLRLAHRLGQTPHNVVVAQVLYRLGLAEQLRGRNGSRVAAFSFDRASAMAEQLEAAGQEPLDFSCTIMVLGKTGVGKSATINSIFDENKFSTDAFQLGTKKVQDVVGTVQGIKVRVIDTPGLLPSWSDQRQNEKILHSVKRFIQKSPPDIVLYLDRLDMQTRDFGDMPLLRTITEIFGPSIWFNAIVVLTHAASAPPEGPNGTATSYDMFVTQRSHVVQQAIRQAAGDMRLMNPVSLVENHSACRTNRAGQRVLPNGQVWKPHLLLLSFASKILAEANTLLKLQDSPPGKPFTARSRAPPLPFLLSTLLQSRPQLKMPQDQLGDDDDTLDDDLDDSSVSDDESEYDRLPPFKRLTNAQLSELSKAQKKAYYDELEYREKLFMKKQLKEEKRRRKMMKKMEASAKDLPSEYTDSVEEESEGAASVPVPVPDMALPASFDSDNPTHRYRALDSLTNQWLVRPVLDSHGWDHDVGYEGINIERLFAIKDKIPVSFSSQATKDKKDANLQMEVASSLKHGEGKATTLGFDMQTLGKDIAYTLRSETRFSNYRRNKATAGVSITHIGDALTAGVKVEDKLIVSKRSQLVASGGAIIGRGDVAYGGSFEFTLRDKDHPLGRFLSTIGASVMDWHGDLAIGWNAQTQIPIGRSSNLIGRVSLNNRGSGQVSIRGNSSEHLQIALVALVPLLNKLLGYSQQVQFGH